MHERRIAVVTGANRGIGLEVARQLVALDVHVVLTARAKARAEVAASQLRAGWVTPVELDVTDGGAVADLGRYVTSEFGRVDVLVNNAGVALDKFVPTLDLDVGRFRETMDTNVYGPLRMCQALVPLMRRRSYGRIVNVGSELGSLARTRGLTLAYRASKAALNMLTRNLAAELADSNILVNTAAPGWVRTQLGGDDAPRTPAQGAEVIVWLATLPDGGPNGGFYQDREPLPF